ncbi:hypothetical protein [Mycolicibacterium canariasense]|uniref:hypothetical protein n=1 Tax=Mycolicibacterium canariasense TaxID=228230 RepID=UPI0013FE454A|nr:hypothetical protein [Mycolicibacterium canariasense]MCV7208385.1 hypothetical protein [Mycolicibacterium canariasense]
MSTEADEAMKAFRVAVMRQAVRYVDAWNIGDGPATFALAVANELTRGGWTIARIS